MSDTFILNEQGEPVPEPDLMKWGRWFETSKRSVAQDEIGDALVSTVFLGLDHAFGGGPPILWKTMIFGGVHDGYQGRYVSRAAALEGNARACDLVRG